MTPTDSKSRGLVPAGGPRFTIVVLFLLAAGCASKSSTAPAPLSGPASPPTSFTLTTPTGLKVTARRTNEQDDYETPTSPSLFVGGAGDPNTYKGSDRKAAKLSISGADLEEYSSVRQLLDTLPPDNDMINHDPAITRAPNSRRTSEEQRNVAVAGFLAAAAKESDNDYHVILCDAPESNTPICINVEVAGLPKSGIYRTRLRAARDQFSALLGGSVPGSGYDLYGTQLRILVSGSLFYDISHPPDAVGPQSLKPRTSWEIHPVATIEEQ
jgi:hypothetical protein